MKNHAIIKGTFLTIAVACITLACDKSGSSTAGTAAATTGTATHIVYVNTDSLLTKFESYKEVMKGMEAKSFQLDNELKNRGQLFQSKVALFQKQVQAGGLAQDVAQTRQAQLQQEQQEIVSYRDQQAQLLSKEQAMKTDEVLTKIQNYLKKYSKEAGFQMCLGYSKGGGVLFADESLDVTKTVLEGLNKEYKASQPAAAVPAKK
jgi:outer membrane protein